MTEDVKDVGKKEDAMKKDVKVQNTSSMNALSEKPD